MSEDFWKAANAAAEGDKFTTRVGPNFCSTCRKGTMATVTWLKGKVNPIKVECDGCGKDSIKGPRSRE